MPIFVMKIAGFFLGSKVGRILGLILAGAIALAVYTQIQRADAVSDALAEIEEVNNELSNNAIDAREARRRCAGAGGLWDFSGVKCTGTE